MLGLSTNCEAGHMLLNSSLVIPCHISSANCLTDTDNNLSLSPVRPLATAPFPPSQSALFSSFTFLSVHRTRNKRFVWPQTSDSPTVLFSPEVRLAFDFSPLRCLCSLDRRLFFRPRHSSTHRQSRPATELVWTYPDSDLTFNGT